MKRRQFMAAAAMPLVSLLPVRAWPALPRRIRKQGLVVHVAPDGDNKADGLSRAKAFRNIQRAVDFILADVDAAGAMHDLVPAIQLADGRYVESVSHQGAVVGADQIKFKGNQSDPSAVQWQAPKGHNCCNVQDLAIGTFSGIAFSAPAGGGGCLVSRQHSVVDVVNCRFGEAVFHMEAQVNATINVVGPYTVTGNAYFHVRANLNSVLLLNSVAIAIPRPAAFEYFAAAVANSTIVATGCTFSGPGAGKGSAGHQGLAAANGVIDRGGAVFPGAKPFVVHSGGQLL
jgi:hypothetical protein